MSAIAQQPLFSVATDLGLQRNIKKEQRYWAVGHTVHTHFHISKKEGLYAWIAYYSIGKFENNVTASAKSTTTMPQQFNYVNKAEMRFKHLSVGWKHYFKGDPHLEEGWNLYGYGGFGLLMGRVINTHSPSVDTSMYDPAVKSGRANFKRLTLDLGLGWETPIGSSVYFYNEGRLWVPTTDYPSGHIFVNRRAPLVASLNFGVRILFD